MNKIYSYIFSIVFFLIISAPFWGILFQKDLGDNKPELSKLSILEPKEMILELDRYASYHHGFRLRMTYEYLKFEMNVLHESPIPDRAILGKEDWLFLGNSYFDVYSSSLGVMSIDSTLINETTRNINKIKLICDSIGVDFYLAIAPNKGSVYPEYLPLKPNRSSRFKEYVTHDLIENYNVKVIDLGASILKKKDSTQVYYKYDSHWNQYGAFLATKDLVDALKGKYNLSSLSENNYIFRRYIKEDGDIAKMLRLNRKEDDYKIWTKNGLSIEDILVKENEKKFYIRNEIEENRPKGLVIRDSFFTLVINLFSTRLSELAFFSVEYPGDGAIVSRTTLFESLKELTGKPDFIILELAERNLLNLRFED